VGAARHRVQKKGFNRRRWLLSIPDFHHTCFDGDAVMNEARSKGAGGNWLQAAKKNCYHRNKQTNFFYHE
jgi:hypothetical protein